MNITAILNNLTATATPPVKKVAVAFSGGVDSTLGVLLLRHIYKAQEIVLITVNIGQGESEMQQVITTAQKIGLTPLIINAEEEFSKEWLGSAIHANSSYNGYPVATSMTRQLIAKIIAQKAQALGCDAILEGSTGKGNDQYRMHYVFKMYAPALTILVPVRDFNLTRQDEIALLNFWGIPTTEEIVGGDDKTLWCRSIASGAISLDQKIDDSVWLWFTPPHKAIDKPVEVEIAFKNGIPYALNGKNIPLHALIEELNSIAGKHGIGLIDMSEDGIMGLKSREIYEAPAATLLLKLHQDLEQFCLTKEVIQFKKIVDAQWGYLVYHGCWYHPLKVALDAFIKTTQIVVNGTYVVSLYKGTITIVKRSLPTSLFFPEIRSITSTAFDQRWCKDTAKVWGLPFELLAKQAANVDLFLAKKSDK